MVTISCREKPAHALSGRILKINDAVVVFACLVFTVGSRYEAQHYVSLWCGPPTERTTFTNNINVEPASDCNERINVSLSTLTLQRNGTSHSGSESNINFTTAFDVTQT